MSAPATAPREAEPRRGREEREDPARAPSPSSSSFSSRSSSSSSQTLPLFLSPPRPSFSCRYPDYHHVAIHRRNHDTVGTLDMLGMLLHGLHVLLLLPASGFRLARGAPRPPRHGTLSLSLSVSLSLSKTRWVCQKRGGGNSKKKRQQLFQQLFQEKVDCGRAPGALLEAEGGGVGARGPR